MNTTMSHRYADLGDQFSSASLPEQFPQPNLLLWNDQLAKYLKLVLSDREKTALLSGQSLFEGSCPVAMAYSGHQFGQFNPYLGDGRAHLLGELEAKDGQVFDIHLKGSGTTPYSRNGDGKCGIKPAVREFIMSEALFALEVPTTRSLSVITTGESIFRQTQTAGAVVSRVARSHIRIGTFEYFAVRNKHKELKQLADYFIERHHPKIINEHQKYVKLIQYVIDKQIKLLVNWMRIGFIHGVLNTDNTLLSGETIDYGPCAMMGIYDPSTVYSSIDHQGRYAFGNQPWIIQWNIARLAECFIPLVNENEDDAIKSLMPLIENFAELYKNAYYKMMAGKIGLLNSSASSDQLVDQLLDIMKSNQLDYTLTFVSLSESLKDSQLAVHPSLVDWFDKWQSLLAENQVDKDSALNCLKTHNPVVIPRNHHIEKVLTETEKSLNPNAVKNFLKVLQSPYILQKNTHLYQDPPKDDDINYQTYCGT